MPLPQPDSEALALELDHADRLRSFRDLFHIPPARAAVGNGGGGGGGPAASGLALLPGVDPDSPSIYLTGNSLGCMPRAVPGMLQQELTDWAALGVEGHLHAAHPWLPYHEFVRESAARLVGARPAEVVCMNSLTVNLHLLMVSFYRPSSERYKIMIEDSAFPSDSHAVASQAAFHARHEGFDPRSAIVRLKPRAGEETLRTDDIVAEIRRHAPSLALVMLGGVNYLTGQFFDMPTITAAGHGAGAMVGWDLAHAAGNVPLRLHDWDVDFAAWCSYKYLNSGPGAVAGAFVHERHLADRTLPQFAGWWGNDPATRFRMGPDFTPVASADRWQLSNPPIFALAPVRASLEIFDQAGLPALREKSLKLTAYLESVIDGVNRDCGNPIAIVTPRDPEQRGCALSLRLNRGVDGALAALKQHGAICDFRHPDIIRAAPVPLYNTFHDVWRFSQVLRAIVA